MKPIAKTTASKPAVSAHIAYGRITHYTVHSVASGVPCFLSPHVGALITCDTEEPTLFPVEEKERSDQVRKRIETKIRHSIDLYHAVRGSLASVMPSAKRLCAEYELRAHREDDVS